MASAASQLHVQCAGHGSKAPLLQAGYIMRTADRIWQTVAATCVGLFLVCALPAGARANFYDQYNCGRIEPNSYCEYPEGHTWDRNAASHSYAINLCEKLIEGPALPLVASRRCAYASHLNGFSDDTGIVPYPNYNMILYSLVANGNNTFFATVSGAADAG